MVVVDIFMTDTAKMADVVLPGTTFLERPEIKDYLGQGAPLVALGNQAIEPIGNCRQEWWIWAELGRRMGYEEHFPWQRAEELIHHLLEPAPFTLEELKNSPGGVYYFGKEYQKYLKNGFNTPSGKVEIFSETLKEHGYDPLPVFTEPVESPITRPDLEREFPLMLLGAHKKRAYTHSQHRNIPSLRKLVPEPLLDIHPETAQRLGISEGDRVRLESPRGSIEIKATITKEVPPGIVAMQYGWSEANVNYLTDDMARDPISGFPALRSVMCRIEKI
jgi:anaerobic selenocysteine-containing dehydrogenase